MSLRSYRAVVTLGCTLLCCSSALAIAPRFVPDEELVCVPTIVVAKWEKTPLAPHHHVEGNVAKDLEVRTEVTVTRVIKGNLKPGKYTILLGPFIGFANKNGGPTCSFTSTEMVGDVEDVKNENLWFLASRRSWDKTDEAVHPALDTYLGVQPLALEPYFRALRNEKPDDAIAKLLGSRDTLVVRRSLQYLAGGELPWPYSSRFDFERPETTRKPLTVKSPVVETLLKRPEAEVRRLAASVYAAMTERQNVPVMRRLLRDDDAEVRAIAVGILARYQDQESLSAFATALKGLNEPDLACQAIDVLAAWKDERVVPSLITFLENDGFAFQLGDDIGIPAIKALHALHATTGLWFPQDVDAAARAWEQVRSIRGPTERERKWKTLVAAVACPVKAELEGSEHEARIVVTNVTGRDVSLAKRPSEIEQRWTGGDATTEKTCNDFVALKPNESGRFKVTLDDNFLHGPPDSRQLTIRYWNAGHKQHLKAWIGTVEVAFGHDWKDVPQSIQKIVEKWPNGNLKTTGEMRGGRHAGRWDYYNERGDRVQVKNFDDGTNAECNPEHPENEGAGRLGANAR